VVEAVNGNIKALLRRKIRLTQPQLPAAKSTTAGRHENQIRRFLKSRVKRTLFQFVG
jgi:hypothetical protein